jgi:hypothetical protein
MYQPNGGKAFRRTSKTVEVFRIVMPVTDFNSLDRTTTTVMMMMTMMMMLSVR